VEIRNDRTAAGSSDQQFRQHRPPQALTDTIRTIAP